MSSRNPTAKGDWGKGKNPNDKESKGKEPQMKADERGGGECLPKGYGQRRNG